MKHYDVEKQAMKSIFSLQKLARTYSHEEIERACQQVRQVTNRPMVKSIQTMIKHISETETAQALQERKQKANNQHAFIRGAAYFGGKK
nr:hypothetical protein [Alkalicoccus luteus]